MRSRNVATLVIAGLALAATASCSSSSTSGSPSAADTGPVKISVDCEPPTTQPADRANWLADVASFEKLHPNITIDSKDSFPCDDPNTFNAKLASGQMADVFYLYFTDAAKVIDSGQAADIQQYISTVPHYTDIQPAVRAVFQQNGNGDVYGLPKSNYSMGLVYNRDLFTKAGLDPNSPPTTWAEVAADAKKISALGNGIVGYGDYSAGNTGGWHFTAEIYSLGGTMVSADGKTAAFNSPQGIAVLDNLKAMRWTDNSMGSKQLLQWADLPTMMASGKLGMYIGAPDNVTTIHDQFKGSFANLGMGPMPGDGSTTPGTLVGGDGYMFNKHDTPAQIKAGLLWLEYENLTPGQGQFNYQRAAAAGLPVGLPQPDLWQGATATADAAAKAKYADLPTSNYQAYVATTPKLKANLEPPQAQAIYKVLDNVMSAVLTNANADPSSLLSQATTQVNSILANAQ
jgi:multiple sugar transport system substrate-binding protein